MDFTLTDEQEALRDLVREFATREIAPVAPKLDEEQRHGEEIVEKYFEIGFLHYAVPEEYGGAGLGTLEGCLFNEEVGAACGGVACTLGGNTLGLTPLFIAGSDELKKELLPPHTEGPNLAAFCLTEAGAGSDAGSMRTTARLEGDEYVINGTKGFITNGSVASLYSVFAMEDPDAGNRGFSAFMVPAGTPGIKIGKKEDKMGQRTSDTREVSFEEVRIPARYRLGEGLDGFKIAMMTLDESRATVGAAAVGIARAALEVATKYAKERVQFGKPIAGHQAIQFMLADMAMKVNAGRHLCWHAAWLKDTGKGNTMESAMAKCFCGDIAMEVTTNAVQVLGGYGYMKDYPVEKYMRDAKLHQIYEGTNEIQRLVIARGLLG
ncbi:MAG: acyl-CoA dehydrogenase [Gemmatimonadetes bacterium]|nr:acyl-CoA dehydrogenase family protein [Gemmatimonadota bacterium]NNM06958.1 acyl-CoA dehydrogenase [Gemmatimonadota bacterium]